MSHSRRSKYESRSRSPYGRGRSFSRSLSRSRSRSRSGYSSDVENPGNNLYVTGLSSRITKDKIERHFATEGKVIDVHLVVDPWTRESRGFGFVTMDTVRDANRCIKYLDRSVLEGRVITVEKAKRRRGRTPTPGRYLGLRTVGERRRSSSYSPYYRGRYSSPAYSSERDRSYSPYYKRHRSRSWSRAPSRRYSPSPVRRRHRSYSRDSRSFSPVQSVSPYYGRHYYRSVSRSLSPRRSVSPRGRCYSPSVSPRPRRSRSYSRSVSPGVRRSYSRSYSPAARSKRSPSYSPLPRRSTTRYSRESYSHSRSISRSSRSLSRSPVRSS
ncbi:serine/arginine-rich splicing factor SR45a-like [Iris pallida]|uniref:Serine/arginine-rich splicing factor SR45a-like n=1 Tax=Iris pallida TaxID=29817 RepID=A0AAX6E0E4_IRIPA|nr:serine/arginine-rich splicing factor SR45a-like [Iris pallida]